MTKSEEELKSPLMKVKMIHLNKEIQVLWMLLLYPPT